MASSSPLFGPSLPPYPEGFKEELQLSCHQFTCYRLTGQPIQDWNDVKKRLAHPTYTGTQVSIKSFAYPISFNKKGCTGLAFSR